MKNNNDKKNNIKKKMYKEFKKNLCKYVALNETDNEIMLYVSHLISINNSKVEMFVDFMCLEENNGYKEYMIDIINGNYENISMAKDVYESWKEYYRPKSQKGVTDLAIDRKHKLLKGMYQALKKDNEEILYEMENQIEICEDLGKGIPEIKIKELLLSCKTEFQVERRVRDFKFAS